MKRAAQVAKLASTVALCGGLLVLALVLIGLFFTPQEVWRW